ncbi:MAG TPA: amino acid adenylation domain-containing protein, partial [Longimicrobiaceae bacterium]|nr:amino acid adenylation domain-containing protein [Longimicrobiaceae bacterium]
AFPEVSLGASCAVRLRGELDPERLRAALSHAVGRNEILRTSFPPPAPGSGPVQVVEEDAGAVLEFRDADDLPAAVDDASWHSAVDGAPLRAVLVRRGEGEHVLHLALPARCADAPTLDALVASVGAAYAAEDPAGAGEPLQYADYCEWLHETLSSAEGEEGRAFWRRQEARPGAPLPELWPVPGARGETGTGVQRLQLPPRLARGADQAAARHGVDAEAWLLGAWRVLLRRHLDEGDFGVGVGLDGRVYEELHGALGPYTRYVPLRGEAGGRQPFAELAGETAAALRAARAWQSFHVWEDGAASLRHGFEYTLLPPQAGRWGDVAWRMEQRWSQTEPFELRLSVERDGEDARISLYHDLRVLPREGAARLLRRYAALLEEALASPGAPVDARGMLDAGERDEVVRAFNPAAGERWAGETLHGRFSAQAERTPAAVALVAGAERVSYAELEARANRLAHHLRRLGVGPERRVALFLERGAEQVVALLGVLKAGGAYVPLDPAYPAERVAYVLGDAGARVLLTTRALRERLGEPAAAVLCLDEAAEEIGREPAAAPPVETGPDNLAYVIYTSGSTGRPKGVQVTHGNATRLFRATGAWFGFGAEDAWTLFHSCAFDFSVWEIWGALLHGGRLVVVPYLTSRSPEAFLRLLAEEGVTVLSQTPSAFRALMAAEVAAGPERIGLSLRVVVFGGEALEPSSLRGWTERHGTERPRLVNMYGITETTVHVTYRELGAEDVERGGRSPVGVPIPDLRVYVVDGELEPVPAGVPGELLVGGAGVARGYLGRAELTAERFVPDGLGSGAGERLYRSGDRARWLPGGELEYLGRIDEQVKVRGYRIEPGEVEAALLRQAGVREAVVVAREDAPGEKRLEGYVVGDAGLVGSEVREGVRGIVPEYMVPSAVVVLESVPLTANGKVDRRALPGPESWGGEAEAGAGYEAPRTPAEEVLAAVWAEVLGVPRVGVHDNFFAAGGDSILAVRVVARARERGVELSVADLFETSTVEELAERTARGTPEGALLEAILRRDRRPFDLVREEDRRRLPDDAEDAYPLSSLQAGMLYHQGLTPDAPAYHNVDSAHLTGRFDEACFRAAVQRAMDRQENLRTSFHLEGFGEPLQVVHRHAVMPIEVEDVRHLDAEAQEAVIRACVDREFATPFDLTRAPLMRMRVHLRADTRFQLTLAESHAVNDGWSLTSLLAEVLVDHAALLRGEPLPERPLPPVRFRDFVELERATMSSGASREFWAERLAGFTPGRLPRLPAAFREPGRRGTELVLVPLAPEVKQGLHELARSLAVPLKSVLLAAHLKVLGLATGQTDVVTGLATNGRPEVAGGTEVRGLFLNTVPLRVELRDGSWEELVRQAYRAETEILPHRRYPLALLQQEHGPEPLTEVSFNLVRFHSFAQAMESGAAEILDGVALGDTSYTLRVAARLHPVTSDIAFTFDYQAAELTREQAEGLADRYRRVMEAMVADPARRHGAVPPVSGAERRQLESWNATERRFSDGACLHHLIEAQARRAP